jgi:hypothetical protein
MLIILIIEIHYVRKYPLHSPLKSRFFNFLSGGDNPRGRSSSSDQSENEPSQESLSPSDEENKDKNSQ